MYIVLFLLFFMSPCPAEIIKYISIEHPQSTYFNPKFFSNVYINARRYYKNDPKYYLQINFTTKIIMNNTFKVAMTFYKFTNNEYKLTFFEVKYKWCDFIEKDMFFGSGLRNGNLNRPCPFPPGEYYVNNTTISIHSMPKTFPFVKGRININTTLEINGTVQQANLGYFDMEIKTMRRKSKD